MYNINEAYLTIDNYLLLFKLNEEESLQNKESILKEFINKNKNKIDFSFKGYSKCLNYFEDKLIENNINVNNYSRKIDSIFQENNLKLIESVKNKDLSLFKIVLKKIFTSIKIEKNKQMTLKESSILTKLPIISLILQIYTLIKVLQILIVSIFKIIFKFAIFVVILALAYYFLYPFIQHLLNVITMMDKFGIIDYLKDVHYKDWISSLLVNLSSFADDLISTSFSAFKDFLSAIIDYIGRLI